MQQRLQDVLVMRPLAIVLMIVWHSFIVYVGGWREPAGYEDVTVYWWIAQFSYAFMLELFVFISGYVFAITLNKDGVTFKGILASKIKRLIVPSLIFSTLYFVLLGGREGSPLKIVYDIVNGYGHFWFLPMLFWSTLFCYVLDRVQLSKWIKVAIVLCLPALSILPIPLRIGVSFYYIPFFYAGIMVYRHRQRVVDSINVAQVILFGSAFIALFLAKCKMNEIKPMFVQSSDSLIVRGGVIEVKLYVRFLAAIAGSAFIYIITNYFVERRCMPIPVWLQDFNQYCFGVYVFQQFILQILYYKTTLPGLVGPYWLPWIGFVIALIFSYALSKSIRYFRVGRTIL